MCLYLRIGKPVLNLDYLLGPVVQVIKPLNWTAFWDKQVNASQSLNVSLSATDVLYCNARISIQWNYTVDSPIMNMNIRNVVYIILQIRMFPYLLYLMYV